MTLGRTFYSELCDRKQQQHTVTAIFRYLLQSGEEAFVINIVIVQYIDYIIKIFINDEQVINNNYGRLNTLFCS